MDRVREVVAVAHPPVCAEASVQNEALTTAFSYGYRSGTLGAYRQDVADGWNMDDLLFHTHRNPEQFGSRAEFWFHDGVPNLERVVRELRSSRFARDPRAVPSCWSNVPIVPVHPANGTRCLGNAAAWKTVRSHLAAKTGAVLVVWGPTGTGKTWGVREVARDEGYATVEFDGSDFSDAEELKTVILQGRRASHDGRRGLVLIDDFEGFTPMQQRAIVAASTQPCAGPMVLTCQHVRDPSSSSISSLPNVQLRRPHREVVIPWFDKCFGRHLVSHEERYGDGVLARGDLRRARISLEWKQRRLGTLGNTTDARQFCNPFDGVRKLMTRRTDVASWAEGVESYDVSLVWHNAVEHMDDVDEMCDFLEATSFVDSTQSRSFHTSYVAHAIGYATRAHLRVRPDAVGAIAPPPRSAFAPRGRTLSSLELDLLKLDKLFKTRS